MSDAALRAVRAPLSGWGRRPLETCTVHRPEDAAALRALVSRAGPAGLTPRGLGRSYGDAALNADGAVVLSERMDHLLAFDAASGVLSCQAAVSFAEILRIFLPRGFFLPVTPGTKNISVGGAIAADVHGKNHHQSGSMSAWVRSLRLLSGGGEILSCSREQNAEAFWATLGGMGLTGMILDAELQLKPVETAFMQAETERLPNLDGLLERMDASDHAYDYAVAWIDSTARGASLGRSVLLRANHAPLAALPASLRTAPHASPPPLQVGVPFTLPSFTLNPLTMRIFNAGYRALNRAGARLTGCNAFFYPLDAVASWNRIYGTRGAIQYQCVIPEREARAGTLRVLESLAASGVGSFLTVLKSLGPESQGLLSFPMPGKTLAMDLPYTGPEVLAAIRKLDEIVLACGGRVYLAKDSCLAPAHFAQMYPRFPEFARIKRALDPEQRFSSSLARRLGLVER